MRSTRLVQSVAIAAMVISSISLAASPALAGGGSALSALQILRHSAKATVLAAEHGVHISGSALFADSVSATAAFPVVLKAPATYSADIVALPKPAAHFKLRFLNHTYRFREADSKVALKAGKKPWECVNNVTGVTGSSPAPAQPPITLGPTSEKGLKKLVQWLHALGRQVRFEIAQSGMVNGIPQWEIVVSLHTQLNLTPLLAIASRSRSAIHYTRAQSWLQKFVHYPHPWVNLKIGIWINQLTYEMQNVNLSFKFREGKSVLSADVKTAFSRYGESLHIVVPTCQAP